VEHHPPKKLEALLRDQLKIGDDVEKGKGRLVELVESVLKYSVNTWDQGFMVCILEWLKLNTST
jgi:glutamate decarboxylase